VLSKIFDVQDTFGTTDSVDAVVSQRETESAFSKIKFIAPLNCTWRKPLCLA
jgi:hypothetical protein